MTRVPAHKRLKDLPEVFTTKTLAAHLGGDAKMASVYLYRWRNEGFISSVGPRVGLHFNLFRNPNAEEDLRLDALAYLFPGAVIAGVSAVHAAGWTTQIPRALEVFVPARRSLPEIDEVSIESRGRAWFSLARRHIGRPGVVPMVEPAFALADLWASGSWRPDPDDIEWDEVDLPGLRSAFSLFGLDLPEEWREEIEGVEVGDRPTGPHP